MLHTYTYREILRRGKYDINKRCLFGKLTEDDEILLTRELTNFVLWANGNLELITSFLKKESVDLFKDEVINKSALVELWLKYIGKNHKIETIITDINVVSDIYEYISLYYDKISIFNMEYDYKMISYAKYRTEEQYVELKDLMNSNSYYNQQINVLLAENKCDLDHIDSKFAAYILNRFGRG